MNMARRNKQLESVLLVQKDSLFLCRPEARIPISLPENSCDKSDFKCKKTLVSMLGSMQWRTIDLCRENYFFLKFSILKCSCIIMNITNAHISNNTDEHICIEKNGERELVLRNMITAMFYFSSKYSHNCSFENAWYVAEQMFMHNNLLRKKKKKRLCYEAGRSPQEYVSLLTSCWD